MATELEAEVPNESARRRRTRERLIDAAYEVFAEHGVHAATVEQIVEEAGFTRGAFYSNFESKEELFFALAERENSRSIRQLEEGTSRLLNVARDGATLDERAIAEIVGSLLALQPDDRRWCLVQSEFRLLAMRNPAVAARFLDHQQSFRAELARVMGSIAERIRLRFRMEILDVVALVVTVYEAAMQEAILAGETGITAARTRAMRMLPALIGNLSEPA